MVEDMYHLTTTRIPVWKESHKHQCPKCRKHCFHFLIEELAPNVQLRGGLRGLEFVVVYRCQRDACDKLSMYKCFVAFKLQTADMFPSIQDD